MSQLVYFTDDSAFLTDLGTVYDQWMKRAEAKSQADRLLDFHTKGVLFGDPPPRSSLAFVLKDLEQCVSSYMVKHDRHGGGSIAAGQAWDHMRRARYRARQLLDEDRRSGLA